MQTKIANILKQQGAPKLNMSNPVQDFGHTITMHSKSIGAHISFFGRGLNVTEMNRRAEVCRAGLEQAGYTVSTSYRFGVAEFSCTKE